MRMVKFVLAVCLIVVLAGAAVAQVKVAPIVAPNTVSGVITSVSLEKSAIALGPMNSNETRVPIVVFVNEKTRIIKDGKIVGLDALKVGDVCKATVTKTQGGELLAVGVWAYTPAPRLQWVSGVIAKISYETGVFVVKLPNTTTALGMEMVFVAGNTTKIVKDGQPVAFSALMTGDMAAVGFVPLPPTFAPTTDPIKAVAIEAKTPPQAIAKVQGKIVELSPASKIVTVQVMNNTTTGSLMKFLATERTVIEKFGKKPFDALCVGDMVTVAYNPYLDVAIPPAISIAVMPLAYSGMIAEIAYEKGVIFAQQSPMGPVIPFRVINETKIYKNGQIATLKQLMPKDQIQVRFFHFPDGNVAQLVQAKSPFVK